MRVLQEPAHPTAMYASHAPCMARSSVPNAVVLLDYLLWCRRGCSTAISPASTSTASQRRQATSWTGRSCTL